MTFKTLRRKYLWFLYQPLYIPIRDFVLSRKRKSDAFVLERLIEQDEPQRIFYLGITQHSNLGDLAQHYCIRQWLKEYFPGVPVYMFESDSVVEKQFGFIDKLKKVIRPNDLIVFQSGYTTQDLGGNHEQMHRMVIDAIPEANILMMPQTIFFQNEENRKRTSISYNKAKKMLFLARDKYSGSQAREMFPNIRVYDYPDIVTSLIGTISFPRQHMGVYFCQRNDGEKLYSNESLNALKKRIRKNGDKVTSGDTSLSLPYFIIRKYLKYFIEREIAKFAKYDVTITDRYHGTIFSLIAGTPVIIIKTTDHKVVTGAEWFRGIYDDYVYVATDLDDAYRIYLDIKNKKLSHHLSSHFNDEYYSAKLRKLVSDVINI